MRMNYRKGKDGEQSEVFYTLRDFALWLLVEHAVFRRSCLERRPEQEMVSD